MHVHSPWRASVGGGGGCRRRRHRGGCIGVVCEVASKAAGIDSGPGGRNTGPYQSKAPLHHIKCIVFTTSKTEMAGQIAHLGSPCAVVVVEKVKGAGAAVVVAAPTCSCSAACNSSTAPIQACTRHMVRARLLYGYPNVSQQYRRHQKVCNVPEVRQSGVCCLLPTRRCRRGTVLHVAADAQGLVYCAHDCETGARNTKLDVVGLTVQRS